MFSSDKIKSKTTLRIRDTDVSYITLAQDEQGIFVDAYEAADLDKGIISKGEILKADFLLQILKKISHSLKDKKVNVLIPHEYFTFELVEFPDIKLRELNKKLKDFILDEQEKYPWFSTHDVEYIVFSEESSHQVLFYGLPFEIAASYKHLLKSAGFSEYPMSSDILALSEFVGELRSSLLTLQDDFMRVSEFKKGVFQSDKKFHTSYNQLIKDIKKGISLPNENNQKARDILVQYGVLRSHKDELIYKKIIKSLNPLVEFFKKRKIKEESQIFVNFQDIPIPGFIDLIHNVSKVSSKELYIFQNKIYQYHEVLTLHKKDSYYYQSLIAQSLKSFSKK